MKTEQSNSIDHVSDTALWVAHYRAMESERPDALFHDSLAKILVGERGRKIAESMGSISRYTQWSVVSRTVIIDEFILKYAAEGVDTILNLGAGLDTRPYRMKLPSELKWIEVDYPNIISMKNDLLKNEKPACQLQRVELDLADGEKRRAFLNSVGASSKKILVLTEGVIIYLDEEQVSSLAADLLAVPSIGYWITEYFHPRVYRYLQATARANKMQRSPFKFYPKDWMEFFKSRGWVREAIQYSGEVAIKTGRRPPLPWYATILRIFMSQQVQEQSLKMAGYMVLRKDK